MINDARIPSQTRPVLGLSKYSGSKPVTDTIDYNRRYFMVENYINYFIVGIVLLYYCNNLQFFLSVIPIVIQHLVACNRVIGLCQLVRRINQTLEL